MSGIAYCAVAFATFILILVLAARQDTILRDDTIDLALSALLAACVASIWPVALILAPFVAATFLVAKVIVRIVPPKRGGA